MASLAFTRIFDFSSIHKGIKFSEVTWVFQVSPGSGTLPSHPSKCHTSLQGYSWFPSCVHSRWSTVPLQIQKPQFILHRMLSVQLVLRALFLICYQYWFRPPGHLACAAPKSPLPPDVETSPPGTKRLSAPKTTTKMVCVQVIITIVHWILIYVCWMSTAQ